MAEIRNDVAVIVLGLLAYFGVTTFASCLLRLCLNPKAVGIKTYEMVVKSILEPDMLLIDSLKHRRELRRVLRENAKIAGKTHKKHTLLCLIFICTAVLILSQALVFWLVRPGNSEVTLREARFPRLTYFTGQRIGGNDGNCIRKDNSNHTQSETTVFSENVCLHTLRYGAVIDAQTTVSKISYKVQENTEPLVTVEVGNLTATQPYYDYIVVKNVASISRGVTPVFLNYGDNIIREVTQGLVKGLNQCTITTPNASIWSGRDYRNITFRCADSKILGQLVTQLPVEQLASLRYGVFESPEFTSELDNTTQSYYPGESTYSDVVTIRKAIALDSGKGGLLVALACLSALTFTAIVIRQDMGATAAFFSRIHEDNSECGRDPLEIDNLPINPSYSEESDGVWHRHVGVHSQTPSPGVVNGVLAGKSSV